MDETQLVLTDRSPLTDGTDYGVQGRNVWRLADLGAKHAFLRAGLGWGHMPHWLVADDLKEGRLERIELEGPAAGVMPFQAVYPAGQLPGPAGRWLLERFSAEFSKTDETARSGGNDDQLTHAGQPVVVEQ